MSEKKVIGFHDIDKHDGYLSNWYPASFTLDGITFGCSEQYLMVQKALLFSDKAAAEAILAEPDPATEQDLGQKVQNYDDQVWAGYRRKVICRALTAKFQQNPDLRDQLLATGDALLCECARCDKTWGIGMHEGDPGWEDPKNWKGENLLGYALMDVRGELRVNDAVNKETGSFRAIYRCRLCGAKFPYGEKLTSVDAKASIAALGNGYDLPPVDTPKTVGHFCSDGACGAADFIGYAKVE